MMSATAGLLVLLSALACALAARLGRATAQPIYMEYAENTVAHAFTRFSAQKF